MVKLSRNPSDEHEFHTMGSRPFEHFVRALHRVQPGILTAYIYGPDGQSQFGADHIATRQDGTADIDVGQSKAYRQFGQSKVREAADAFLDHWDWEWRDKRVKRFILFVGCAINRGRRRTRSSPRPSASRHLALSSWSGMPTPFTID